MKIVEAISDSNVGGAGMVILSRIRHSDRTKFSYHVMIPRGSALKERFRSVGAVVWELDGCRDRSFSVRGIFRYCFLLRYLQPDLVNCHGTLSCRIAAWLCRVPCRLYTRHCAYPPPVWQTVFPGKWLCGRVQMLLSPHGIAVADAAKKNLTDTGMAEERIHVIVNGAERLRKCSAAETDAVRKCFRIPLDAIVVGIFARLEPCKDHDTFLAAAERLLARSAAYRFLIVGDGSERKRLERLCRERKLDPYVIFTGFVEDVAPYFHLIRVNVNCSVGTETSSLALSEGMSLGIPAVASDYGGNPYLIRQGENGCIYPRRDAEALANAVAAVAEDSDFYRRLSDGARLRFEQELNAAVMTEKTEQLYEELFGSVKDRETKLLRKNKSVKQSRRQSL